MSRGNRVLLGLSILFLLFFLYHAVVQPFGSLLIPLPAVPMRTSLSTVALLLFSVLHGVYLLGWRNTLVFFGLSAVISWTFEQVGVATGAIYGAYHYTDVLGAKLGHVPFLIPLAWFMMIYPGYVIANLIVEGEPGGTRGGVVRVVWLSVLSAFIVTAWDVVMDPAMSGGRMTAWIWEQGGPYFGVPYQNFLGWLLTTFVIYLLYRFYERRFARRSVGPLRPWIVALPVIAYGGMMLAYMAPGFQPELRLVAAFAMGIPALLAAGRIGGHTGKMA